MKPFNPKYRTHDSPPYEEPIVDWGPSLTDPSQDVPISKLVERHVRMGSPAHGLPYGEDLSRVGFTELHLAAGEVASLAERQKAEAAQLQQKQAAEKAAAQQQLRDKLLKQLKAGSPELQQLAQELTLVLPGFQAAVPPAEGGGS